MTTQFQRIYLDNNATTALDPRVFKAMLADLSGPPANPSSVHWHGQMARNLLSKARQTVASFFLAKPEEIIFTSGGTEGMNFLIRGLKIKSHVITTSIEHSAVYKTLQARQAEGLDVTYLPVGLFGAPTPQEIAAAIKPNTEAIFLSLSNGETGVKIDVDKISQLAQAKEIPLFLDAVSYVGKEPLHLPPGITGAAISGHKFHAPKGIGAIYLRSNAKIAPLITGGGQEYQKRAGTENLSGILGLAEAIQILQEKQAEITQSLRDLRSRLETELFRTIPDIVINGEGPRISNVSNLAFLGVDGETLLMHLDMVGISVSHGSACSSGSLEPSRVLTQMGVDRKIAKSSIRISLSRFNTREEVDLTVERISQVVSKLRKLRNFV